MSTQKIIIATRGSGLALAQSEWTKTQLSKAWPDYEIELLKIKTTGDRLQTRFDPSEKLDKGLFTKEIEEALLEGRADIAVHSLKDLPTELPDSLDLGAVPPRESAKDILIMKQGFSLEGFVNGGLVLTGSKRRAMQWKEAYPKSEILPIRGNVDTRIRKLREHEEAKAIILAEAGINRLKPNINQVGVLPLDYSMMLPAPGQGALGLEVRANDVLIKKLLKPLHCAETFACVQSERSFLNAMGGGCNAPLGSYASTDGKHLHLRGVYYQDDTAKAIHAEVKGLAKNALAIGIQLADRVKEQR
ncbi:MAG: hydroxymethylbilane synthase [Verrucomicrobiota bacterium]